MTKTAAAPWYPVAMKILYADSLFALSLLTDYLLCLSAGRLCGLTLRRGRYLAAAALGAVYAVAVFLPGLGWLALPVMQLVAARSLSTTCAWWSTSPSALKTPASTSRT